MPDSVRRWYDIQDRLTRIEIVLRAIYREVRKDMAELDDELDSIEAAESAEQADLARVIADLEAKAQAGTITDEERSRLQALQAAIEADTAALDQADPPAAQ